MTKHSRKYKKKLRKYAKKTKRTIDAGVRIWNRLNTSQNRKTLGKMGKKASRMQQNLIEIL